MYASILKKHNYIPIDKLPRKVVRLIPNISENLTVYGKLTEQLIEFTDSNDKNLWHTNLSVTSFIVFNGDILYDRFLTFTEPFRIRNEYEIQQLNEIISDINEEFELIESELLESEITNLTEETIYES